MGYDLTHFRYGLAFSIEPSKTLPNPIQALTPKIKKFNCLINERPELFEGYKMWYWRGGKHVDCGNVCAILPSNGMNIANNTFIFFGKLVDVDKTSVEDILSTFDSMLEIYCIIENDDKQVIDSVELAQSIRGGIGTIKRPFAVQYTNEEKLISVSYIHASIQEKLGADLKIQFGEENVKFECLTPFGKKVDIYVTDQNKKILYEVKIASSLEDCMRQAIGQLLEYGFWDGNKQADKLVIVGEYRLTPQGKKYLDYLNATFNLPISYHQVEL